MPKFNFLNNRKLLFLDVGNTAIKAAFKTERDAADFQTQKLKNLDELTRWLAHSPELFNEIVLSSVKTGIVETLSQVLPQTAVTSITTGQIPSALLDYETPETLGIDRFLVCYGAVKLVKKAVVVIDVGTATTIDFMSADNVYRGGVIAPGYSAFSKLLHRIAPALPQTDAIIPQTWPGKSTMDSIRWGQAGFYMSAIHSLLAKYREAFGNFDTYITGGDAAVLLPFFQNEVHHRPNLVFEGMQRFLEEV